MSPESRTNRPPPEENFPNHKDLSLNSYKNAFVVGGEFIISTRTEAGRQTIGVDIVCPDGYSIEKMSVDRGRSGEVPRSQKDRHFGDFNTRFVILAKGEAAVIQNKYRLFYSGEGYNPKEDVRRFNLRSSVEISLEEIPWTNNLKDFTTRLSPIQT